MACVDNFQQSGFEQYHDAMAMRRSSIQRMTKSSSALLQVKEDKKPITFRVYESQQPQTQAKQPSRHSFVKRCSQIATGCRRSITSTYTAQQAPKLAQWIQRLPPHPVDYEAFLESAMEEAVGQLVCGPDSAAEELELGYNYDTLEDALPQSWVRVRAQLVECKGRSWIAASVMSRVDPEERPETYAYGKWQLVNTRKYY
ncbi:uncharacterized protein CLAFUR5_10341 [Fulvia fulva]|uniref:Uncharacterized protein n=1 Tax=Passalora fulva TaxID=5499 RepID=A0A9Q8URT8_PASFU|nr:uncharacterized protein CLAFUR5_10341 [Fulvia fulva]KAK4620574.1 hypothetical protein CLAFUR0_11312 [Fulvia fulva]UJO20067.1 hypothetical protein CLAFUR5_10341 [Fulvia fulva]